MHRYGVRGFAALLVFGSLYTPALAQQATDPWVDPPEVDGGSAGFFVSGSHAVQCRGGATSMNPDQSIQVEVGIIVEGVVIARNWAYGWKPVAVANGTVPYAEHPRSIVCYMQAPLAQDESSGTILPQCGDERTTIIEEYKTHNVNWTPSCSDVRSAGGTANFTWSELNGGFSNGNPHATWGIVTATLETEIENTRTNYNRGGIRLSSGYRCPHGHASIPGAASQSIHMRGQAVDMYSASHSWTETEFDLLKAAAVATGNTVEAFNWDTYPDRHLHVAW